MSVEPESRRRMRRQGPAMLRGRAIPKTTTDQRLLDRRGPSDWVHTDPWRVLRIQAEFVEGFGLLAEMGKAVAVFGSSRARPGSAQYELATRITAALARAGAKLGAGTMLTATTHVIDVTTGEELPRGEAPAWSVCVSGTRVRGFPGGDFGMPCVLVLRRLAEGTEHDRLALNEILRDHGVSG